MNITNIKVTRWVNKNVIGFASVELDGALKIPNITIKNGKFGKYIDLPEVKGKDGEYYPVIYMTRELKEKIAEEVFKAI